MLISNSEVSTFQTCQRKHYYSFREALKPREGHSKALTRGIVGHEALERYYNSKKNGEKRADCEHIMKQTIDEFTDKYPHYAKELQQLKQILTQYVDFYWAEPWRILEVESLHSTFLDNSTVEYGLRLDLLVEVTSGREKGQIHVVDHKFVYDFFNDREKAMNTQLIKYMKTLRDNGIPVRKGVLNQIRYRSLKEPDPYRMFRRDSIVTTDKESELFVHEFTKVARIIEKLYLADPIKHKEATTMHIDKATCGSCSFQPLCKLYLQGLDETRTKNLLYVHNEYVDQYREET